MSECGVASRCFNVLSDHVLLQAVLMLLSGCVVLQLSCPNILSGHVVLQVVVVQWKFLQFNVLEGRSALFGTSSWHRCVRGCWEDKVKELTQILLMQVLHTGCTLPAVYLPPPLSSGSMAVPSLHTHSILDGSVEYCCTELSGTQGTSVLTTCTAHCFTVCR